MKWKGLCQSPDSLWKPVVFPEGVGRGWKVGAVLYLKVKTSAFQLVPWFSSWENRRGPVPAHSNSQAIAGLEGQFSRAARQLLATMPAFSPLWTRQQDEVTRAPSLCHYTTQPPPCGGYKKNSHRAPHKPHRAAGCSPDPPALPT